MDNPNILTKLCKVCNVEKSIEDFYLIKKTESKRRHLCKDCANAQRVKIYFDKYVKKPTGIDRYVELKIITPEQKEEIIELLNNPAVKVKFISKKYNVCYNLLLAYRNKKLKASNN
jgi:uncharacterized protein VirK/YbjX